MKNILENWHKYLSENQKRKINIFLDMDGVLVDFASSVREYIKDGYSVDADIFFPDSKSSRALHRKLQRLNLSSSELEDLYDRAAAKFQSGEEYSPQEHLIHNYIFKILINNKLPKRQKKNGSLATSHKLIRQMLMLIETKAAALSDW